MRPKRSWRVCCVLLVIAAGAQARASDLHSPADVFGPLYAAVQQSGVFTDSKTFADAVPLAPPADILRAYRLDPPRDLPQWRDFLARHFQMPASPLAPAPPPGATLKMHIATLWPLLTRRPQRPEAHSSLLHVPRPYVVPGGRFREFYYWDSYFTMLGLVRDGHRDTAQDLLDDFTYLLRHHGRIPNGNRTYYLSRSQPPFFYLMVELLADGDDGKAAAYLPALRIEHAFWMRGAARVARGSATRRVVRLADGSLLNRYWDDKDTPRDESYREDVALAATSGREAPAVHRDVRAAAESGWDFSSRWLADGHTLSSIRTTAIVPADLNSLLYGLERSIARLCARQHDVACDRDYSAAARHRAAAIQRHLWDEASGRFADLDFVHDTRTPFGSAATVYPLFVGLASRRQAARVAQYLEQNLLKPGGLAATPAHTGEQWDAPNGWAPLQWLAITGLDRYGQRDLADDIAQRWLGTVRRVYGETGKLLEKYDVEQARPGGGGEYPLQDGFGWTNGVTRALLVRPPR